MTETRAISTLLVDDHTLIRQALRALLESERDIAVGSIAGRDRVSTS